MPLIEKRGPITETSDSDRENRKEMANDPIWKKNNKQIDERYANNGYSDHSIFPSSKLRKVQMNDAPSMRHHLVNDFNE